ncbi:MAG: RsmD family RNA methyltransferase [Bacteroidia bacterium]|nr:RsmD family RNA methyltransferase [Bacteroidia bacterium]HQV01581.1 RsmD family RNA methyltransferase [Bacteroidia bacterium]
MRIISGKLKGKTIVAPKHLPVRPTTDFAKTGLFNILNNQYQFETLSILDLFTGTGAISYEFASRNCENILAIDMHAACVKFVNSVFKKWQCIGCEAQQSDAFLFLKKCNESFDIIFADPPYDLPQIENLVTLILDRNLLKPRGVFILEHEHNRPIQTKILPDDVRNYGNVSFSFFKSTT